MARLRLLLSTWMKHTEKNHQKHQKKNHCLRYLYWLLLQQLFALKYQRALRLKQCLLSRVYPSCSFLSFYVSCCTPLGIHFSFQEISILFLWDHSPLKGQAEQTETQRPHLSMRKRFNFEADREEWAAQRGCRGYISEDIPK